MGLTGGSLCTGAGGLDLGLERTLGIEWVWHAEPDDACQRILEQHWPGVPNHGDIFNVDWDTVERVDLVAAGFPCPDYSHAGRRAGIEGDHGQVWFAVARALRALRPSYVILENVPGIRTAAGLRLDAGESALGVVLADLAALGYWWAYDGLGAADLGAPHLRERWFCVAALTDPAGGGRGRRQDNEGCWPTERDGAAEHGEALADAERERLDRSGERDEGSAARGGRHRRAVSEGSSETAADAAGRGRGRRSSDPGRGDAENGPPPLGIEGERPACDCARRGDETAADPAGARRGEHERAADAGVRGAGRQSDAARGVEEGDRDEPRPCGETTSDADEATGARQPDASERSPRRRVASGRGSEGDERRVDWGVYEAAVERWERTIGRPAPTPTDERGRLAPEFVEWMLGYPAGWFAVAGVSRTKALRALGNSVQVQCAEQVGLWLARLVAEGLLPA